MNRVFKYSFILYLLLPACFFGQDLQSLENSYISLQSRISSEYRNIDSLNSVLVQKAKQINEEKEKNDPDEEYIVKMMSSSASVSNRIDGHKNKLKDLQKKNDIITRDLTAGYNRSIDSLKNLISSGKGNRKENEAAILLLTEKRLIIEPAIQNLSFKPDKILRLDHSKLNDKKEKTAYTDYLQSALSEVETVLANVIDKSSKIDEIIALQKKTQKFLKEMEYEGRPTSRKYSLNSSLKTFESTRGGDFLTPGVSNDALNSQVFAYNLLLNQLTFDKSVSTDIQWEISLTPGKVYSIDDYRELLKELKKNLAEYKSILKNKLETLR
jgi:hypothetical protein